MSDVQTPAIGIDLGTTNSCVAVVLNGRVEVIANEMGKRITPSCVAFTEEERLIGHAAKYQAIFNSKNTIFDAKRLMGMKYHDENIQNRIRLWPFNVVESSGHPRFRVQYKNEMKDFSPEEISAMILQKMKAIAETYIGSPVKDAVVTVPAYFNDSQRQATMDAGKIAGLNIVSLLNEPSAAAIAYGFNQKKGMRQNVLVFDFGGGTFDVAILSITENDFEVIATSGDTSLGGSDIDERLVVHFIEEIKKKHNKDISDKEIKVKNEEDSSKILTKLRNACERAKRNLSSSTQSEVLSESLFDGIDFRANLSQTRLTKLCSDLFTKTINIVEAVLESSKMGVDDIDEIVLAGGSTRIPKIQELLQGKFNNKKLNHKIHPDEAVAYGAAVYAASISSDKTIENIKFVDVAPLTLGINVLGNLMSPIIPRNTKLPATVMKKYVTTVDYQSGVDIKVYEGERLSSDENNLLGEFSLENIQPAKKGIPQIEVSFVVDMNGILTVTAEDTATGRNEEIVIRCNKGRLPKHEVERMITEAKEFQKEDDKKEKLRAARHELETLCVEVKDLISEQRDDDLENLELDNFWGVYTDTEEWLDEAEQATEEEYRSRYDALVEVKERMVSN
ncbi:heat shock 70 kDa protein II-like [Hyalella azteca]|uniref:Heat shock 70 kDa protein II-like n=1 Tax=Hyalella azteca TaxID=294128 RepID=A0A8B7PBX5_HYAAZ|nr:heat shock 70 kDa protein II-like [Hyalella azteca]